MNFKLDLNRRLRRTYQCRNNSTLRWVIGTSSGRRPKRWLISRTLFNAKKRLRWKPSRSALFKCKRTMIQYWQSLIRWHRHSTKLTSRTKFWCLNIKRWWIESKSSKHEGVSLMKVQRFAKRAAKTSMRRRTLTGLAAHINQSLAVRCGGAVVKLQKKLGVASSLSMKSRMRTRKTKMAVPC